MGPPTGPAGTGPFKITKVGVASVGGPLSYPRTGARRRAVWRGEVTMHAKPQRGVFCDSQGRCPWETRAAFVCPCYNAGTGNRACFGLTR